ncbi:MAG TPA: hypothetical protein VMN58_06775 [Acidimicrobiales bacterium]|nr:hypothetical protein [Acidimicrobiales bacterium]
MALLKRKNDAPAKGDRVVAARDLVGIREGTAGRIEMVVGLTWTRCWVQFDTGEWMGSIDAKDLVPEHDWSAYQIRRAEAEARAAEEARNPPPAAEAPAATTAPSGGGGPASRIPAHILDRSKAARERLPKS